MGLARRQQEDREAHIKIGKGHYDRSCWPRVMPRRGGGIPSIAHLSSRPARAALTSSHCVIYKPQLPHLRAFVSLCEASILFDRSTRSEVFRRDDAEAVIRIQLGCPIVVVPQCGIVRIDEPFNNGGATIFRNDRVLQRVELIRSGLR